MKCSEEDLAVFVAIECDGIHRINFEGSLHLINAEPRVLMNHPDLSDETRSFLRDAHNACARVEIFPGSKRMQRV